MSEKRILEVQGQARVRAEQAQDFFHDLELWERNISQKDDQLKRAHVVSQKLPPIRSLSTQSSSSTTIPSVSNASTSNQAKLTAETKTQERQQQRIKSSDYHSWDKFDVEGELKKLDMEGLENDANKKQEHSNLNDTVDPDAGISGKSREMSDFELRAHMAQCEKEDGNLQFKEGKFQAAVECYTRGLEIDPNSAVLYANRAMANLKLKKFDLVIRDASKAIQLDPSYIKAYSRRAIAYVSLNKFDLAIKDWSSILRQDNNHKQARMELSKTKKKKKDYDESQLRSFNPLERAIQMRETKKQQRDAKPLIRIPIEEIGTPIPSDEDEDHDTGSHIHSLRNKLSSNESSPNQKEVHTSTYSSNSLRTGENSENIKRFTIHTPTTTTLQSPTSSLESTNQTERNSSFQKQLLTNQSSRSEIANIGGITVNQTEDCSDEAVGSYMRGPRNPTVATKDSVENLDHQNERQHRRQSAKESEVDYVQSCNSEPAKQSKNGDLTADQDSDRSITTGRHQVGARPLPTTGAEFMFQYHKFQQSEVSLRKFLMALRPSQLRQFLSTQVEMAHILTGVPTLAMETERPIGAFKRIQAIMTARRADVVLQFLDSADVSKLQVCIRALGERALAKGTNKIQETHVKALLELLK